MKMHLASVVVLLLAPAIAGTSAASQASQNGAAHHSARTPKGEVSFVGCLQHESDYRQSADLSRGGPLHTGAGQKDEYVITNARPLAEGKSPIGTSGREGRAFILGGKLEKNLADAINREIEVVGTVHEPDKATKDALAKVTVTAWHPVGDFCPAK